MKSPSNDTGTKVDRAAVNSKNRMYRAAQRVESEGRQASDKISGSVDKAANEADAAATKAANSARDRMFKAARAVEQAQKEAIGSIEATMETIEARLETAAREAAAHATDSAEEAADCARQKASESSAAVASIEEKIAEATMLLDNLRQVHGISTDVAVGGSHDKTSQEENQAANEWRAKSIRFRWWTALAAAVYTVSTIAFPPEGWEWALRSPLGASAVVVLAWMAKYASDQSSEHRIAANIYKHQSLAFASLRHYAQDISEMSSAEMDLRGRYGDDDIETEDGSRTTSGLLTGEILKTLFTNQIDAFTEQIRSAGPSEKSWLRRSRPN